MEFGPDKPVSMFTGTGSVVFRDQIKILRDGAHGIDVPIKFHVQHRAHTQAVDRGMCIPRAYGAVLVKNDDEEAAFPV